MHLVPSPSPMNHHQLFTSLKLSPSSSALIVSTRRLASLHFSSGLKENVESVTLNVGSVILVRVSDALFLKGMIYYRICGMSRLARP